MKHLLSLFLFIFLGLSYTQAQSLSTEPIRVSSWHKNTVITCENDDLSIRMLARVRKNKATQHRSKNLKIDDTSYTLFLKNGTINIQNEKGENVLLTTPNRGEVYIGENRYTRVIKMFSKQITYQNHKGEDIIKGYLEQNGIRLEVLDETQADAPYLLVLALEEMLQKAKNIYEAYDLLWCASDLVIGGL